MGKSLVFSCIVSVLVSSLSAESYQITVLHDPESRPAYATCIDSGNAGGYAVGVRTLPIFWTPPDNALTWTSGSTAGSNQHSTDYYSTNIYGCHEASQAGSGWIIQSPTLPFPTKNVETTQHALLWTGSGTGPIDLHPEGYNNSQASGVWQNQQVGSGDMECNPFYDSHALLWNGSADNYVNLHPQHIFDKTCAIGIWGQQQVGYGIKNEYPFPPSARAQNIALLWEGTADSWTSLHPEGYFHSSANAVWNHRQVGHAGFDQSATPFGPHHAMLWYDTAESFVDLHPEGFSSSQAHGIYDDKQVGFGDINEEGDGRGISHALLWTGTAESVIDLHAFLPDIFVSSMASGIDEFGNIVGTAYTDDMAYGIIWSPIPEPATIGLMLLGAWIGIRRKQ